MPTGLVRVDYRPAAYRIFNLDNSNWNCKRKIERYSKCLSTTSCPI